jgi:hypothetical protein
MYVHRCDEETTTEIELLAVVQATLRGMNNGKRFWIRDDSDIHEDGQGVAVSSIYCTTCEKFVVSFDDLNGRDLLTVENELEDGAYAQDGIEWEE